MLYPLDANSNSPTFWPELAASPMKASPSKKSAAREPAGGFVFEMVYPDVRYPKGELGTLFLHGIGWPKLSSFPSTSAIMNSRMPYSSLRSSWRTATAAAW